MVGRRGVGTVVFLFLCLNSEMSAVASAQVSATSVQESIATNTTLVTVIAPDNGPVAASENGPVESKPAVPCEDGHGLIDGVCTICPQGQYGNGFVCEDCPDGTTTTVPGAKSHLECSRAASGVPTWYMQILLTLLVFIRIVTLFMFNGILNVEDKHKRGMKKKTRQTVYTALAFVLSAIWIGAAVPKLKDTQNTNYFPVFVLTVIICSILMVSVIYELRKGTDSKSSLIFNIATNIVILIGANRVFKLRNDRGNNDIGITVMLFIALQLAVFSKFEVLKKIGARSVDHELKMCIAIFFAITFLIFIGLPLLFLFGLNADPDRTIEASLFGGIDTSLTLFSHLAIGVSIFLQFFQTLHESHAVTTEDAKTAFEGIYSLDYMLNNNFDCEKHPQAHITDWNVNDLKKELATFLDRFPHIVCPMLEEMGVDWVDTLQFLLGNAPSEKLSCAEEGSTQAEIVLEAWKKDTHIPEKIGCKHMSETVRTLEHATKMVFKEQNALSSVSAFLQTDYANSFLLQLFVFTELYTAIPAIVRYGMDVKKNEKSAAQTQLRWLVAFAAIFICTLFGAVVWQAKQDKKQLGGTASLWDQLLKEHVMINLKV